MPTIEELLAGLPRVAKDGTARLDKSHPNYRAAIEALAAALNWPVDKVSLAFGHVAPKMSVGVNFCRWGLNGHIEMLFSIKMQEQIGKGDPPKWTLAGGGFIRSDVYESPEQCAIRNAKAQFGIDLVLPKYPMWAMLTKAPYDVTNETQVHGIVCKMPALVGEEESEFLLQRISGKGSQGQWYGRDAFSNMLVLGNHSLDQSEIDFAYECMKTNYPFAKVTW